ncbi:C-terminal domain of homeodomain 1-domain-containing protein [Mycena leptocephala]|nr:C-terminal domain of homeodomain 1-domain-containing protein [Mycena leptocephala]
MALSIRQRLLTIESQFLSVLPMDNLDHANSFAQKWAELDVDVKAALNTNNLDQDTINLAHNVASKVAIFADVFLALGRDSENISTALVNQLETVFDDLTIDGHIVDTPSPGHIFPPSTSNVTTRTDPSLPPYIEPAYKWLLKHLHNPYPKKEIKERIADETGSSMERISDWFVDVRRRMGWTRLLREEFGRKRVDLIDAATRYYVHPNRKYPLPTDIHGRFVEMEAFAREMYAAKFVPSALSNKLTAAVKEITPELQEKARLERRQKLQAEREAAKLGFYPSPAPSGSSSPISDPGASTSFAGRKRSSSEVSDADDSFTKRSRTDDFGLPSPPLSGYSSPATRKRRLSDADGPGAKRPRNRATSAPIPVSVTLTGTPDILADWFSSDREGDTNLFEPGQLLDIKFFDPSEYNFPEEEAPAPVEPVVKTTTLPPTFEPDTVTFEVPAEQIFDFDAMFRDGFCQRNLRIWIRSCLRPVPRWPNCL